MLTDHTQARPGEKHPTLKELLQKPLLLNRPVLYVSLQPWLADHVIPSTHNHTHTLFCVLHSKADNLSDDMPSEASATSVSSKETRSRSRGGKETKG